MPTSLRTLSLLALLAAAAPLHAQDSTADAPAADAAADPAPAAATPGGDLSMGVPADQASGEPQVGQPYIRESFGDWGLRCLKTEDGQDPCQLYQLLQDADGNAVAEFSVVPLADGGEAAAGATIVAPLETLLTAGLTLSVDGRNARTYPFTFCNRGGCVARIGLTADEIQQFRNGNAGEILLIPAAAPDQQVKLAVSLSGFTAGYTAAGETAPAVADQ